MEIHVWLPRVLYLVDVLNVIPFPSARCHRLHSRLRRAHDSRPVDANNTAEFVLLDPSQDCGHCTDEIESVIVHGIHLVMYCALK